ncbi:hypothetical protein [Streptomyces gobiensis]|uniref:hypothetical protein n=1 Tax=Streptomyces gobiensis TaxID=2875706 RepID=UPI001E47CADE|nr:hypothetical protein [Streptomyces gobiensis]UGY94568.1 hypothetical protein test1122_24440 [Streptomyces gobiensis]
MRYEMRAEYGPAGRSEESPEPAALGPVKVWHMVREGETAALCGRDLSAQAATQSAEAWGATTEPFCHTCGALYLREVP